MLDPAGRSTDNKSGANQDKKKMLAPVMKQKGINYVKNEVGKRKGSASKTPTLAHSC